MGKEDNHTDITINGMFKQNTSNGFKIDIIYRLVSVLNGKPS